MGKRQMDQPAEPDWDELADQLQAAERWLLSEDGLDEENCIVRREAIALALGTITGVESGEDHDTTVRLFFEQINRAAFWLSSSVKDEALAEWITRFCIEPERIEAERL